MGAMSEAPVRLDATAKRIIELLAKRIRAVPSVRSTESFVYLKLRKQLYNWGTR